MFPFYSLNVFGRAQKRLEGEYVFGNPISVGLPQRSNCPISDSIPPFDSGGGGYMRYSMELPPTWLHHTNIYGLYGDNSWNSGSTGCVSSNRASHWYPCRAVNVAEVPISNLRSPTAGQTTYNNTDQKLKLNPSKSLNDEHHQFPPKLSPPDLTVGRRSLDAFRPKGPSMNYPDERKCRTPSPNSMNGQQRNFDQVSSSYGGQRSLNQVSSNYSGQSGQEKSHVQLNITNLDQRIQPMEMKKMLLKLFSSHVVVLHLSLHLQSDSNFAALIKVPSLQDAQLAISKLHRVKVGKKRIIISYPPTGQPHDPQVIRGQVVSLLREVPGYKLPLFKFLEMFEARFASTLSVSELHKLKDIVTVVNDTKGRLVYLNSDHRNSPSPCIPQEVEVFCVLHYTGSKSCGWAEQELPPLPRVSVRLAEFRENITQLVNLHNDVLPLASIYDCYTAQFGSLTINKDGVPLEHLVTCVLSVELDMNNSSVKYLRPARPASPSLDESTVCNGKPTSTNGGSLGGAGRLNLTLQGQIHLFGREVVDLLKTQPQTQISFHKFVPAYHHHFGRQCRVANYGFTKLIDLLEAIPNIVQVMGDGSKRVVTLSHRAQMRRFTSDVLRVVKSQPLMQATGSELPHLFEKTLGHALDPPDYGLCYLQDLIDELPKTTVSVTHVESDVILAIPKKQQALSEAQKTEDFSKQVVELLSHTQNCSILFNKFIPAYHHHFGYQCKVADFGFTKLIELFEAIPDVVEIDERSDGEKRVSLVLEEKMRVLNDQIGSLVGVRFPPGLPLSSLPAAYLWQYGHSLKPQVYSANSFRQLVSNISSVKVIEADCGETLVPVDQWIVQLLEQQVRRLLMDSPNGRMNVSNLKQTFNACFHNYLTSAALPGLMKNSVKVENEGGVDVVSLQKKDEEARKLYLILREAPDGKLPLAVLEDYYKLQYGHPIPTHGYTTVFDLLQSLGHTLKVRGKTHNRMVSLNGDLFFDKKGGKNVSNSTPPGFLFEYGPSTNPWAENKEESPIKTPQKWSPVWSNGLTESDFEKDEMPIVNLPKMATPPANIVSESMLLSPFKGLLPANLHPLLSAPHPSQLPRPTEICQRSDDKEVEAQTPPRRDTSSPHVSTKRKLKLAAQFQTPLS